MSSKADLQAEAEDRGLSVPPGATKSQLEQLLADNPAPEAETENQPGETDPAEAPPGQTPDEPSPGEDQPQPGEIAPPAGAPVETPAADPGQSEPTPGEPGVDDPPDTETGGQPVSPDTERDPDKADETGPVEDDTQPTAGLADQSHPASSQDAPDDGQGQEEGATEPTVAGSPADTDDRSLEEQAEAQSEVAAESDQVRREEQEAHDVDADALDQQAVESEVESQQGLTMLVPGYVAVIGHRTDDQGLVRPTDTNRRSDRDVIPGRFCRIAEGEHQGRYGVLMDVKGPPDDDGFPTEALVMTRDDLHEDLVVGYDQLAPANPGGR
jgi:hypothetical protein